MLDDRALDILFRQARTQRAWLDQPVSAAQLQQIYDLMKWGPTSANCTPARIVFVQSEQAKQKLVPCMNEGNRQKTMAAPVTAILGMDMEFYEKLPALYPHGDARSWFAGRPALIETTALRNASLQGGYFILAARALGLDCAPMSGFDAEMMDQAFFAGTSIRTNFVCSLGYGDKSKLAARGPRLDFTEACSII